MTAEPATTKVLSAREELNTAIAPIAITNALITNNAPTRTLKRVLIRIPLWTVAIMIMAFDPPPKVFIGYKTETFVMQKARSVPGQG
jgi:hypothetical protein